MSCFILGVELAEEETEGTDEFTSSGWIFGQSVISMTGNSRNLKELGMQIVNILS